jgi:hypothetical protein
MHPKIQGLTSEGHPKDLLIVLYGIGGIGKTTTACQAPAPLVLDCTGGLRFQSMDTWKVGGARDLAEAVAYVKAAVNGNGNGSFPYRSLILDGLDHLYHRMVKTEGGRDLRDRHRTAQEVLHPLLFELWALPLTKLVVLNEHCERDDRSGYERVEMDLPPGKRRAD